MARIPRKTLSPTDTIDPRFEGSAYSNPECEYLLEHLGEPSIVAMPPGDELPEGVNESQVQPILDRTYQLDLYQASMRERLNNDELQLWCGFEKLRQVLTDTLVWRGTVQDLRRRTRGSSAEMRRAAAAPSLHMWDPDTDIPYLGGIGADCDRTLTALDEGGVRIPLYTELQMTGDGALRSFAGVAKFVRSQTVSEQQSKLATTTPSELIFTQHEVTATVMCPICMKSEEYETLKPTTKIQAMKRMMEHLKKATTRRDQHQLLQTRLKSGKAGSVSNAQKVADLRAARAEETVEADA